MLAPIAKSIGGGPSPAQTKFDSNIPPYDIDDLLTYDALIEAAGNTLEAFATVRYWYDLMDMDFVNAILWLRKTRRYEEWRSSGGV